MAEILDNYDFSSTRKRGSIYPWEEWFDGKIRKLSRGDDFKGTAESFRVGAYNAAKKSGVTIQTRILDENSVVLRAIR